MGSLRAIRKIKGHIGGTTSLSFSPDGTTLATGGYDCCVRLWEAATGQQKHSFVGHRRGHVAFSPDGSLLVSSGLHADAIVYDCVTWQVKQILLGTSTAWGATFLPDGNRLAIIQPETPIQLWDTQTWQVAERIEVGCNYIYALAFTPDSRLLVYAAPENGTVHVLRMDSLEEQAAFSAHQPFTYGMAFSTDGMMLATGGADKTVRLWETSEWREVWQGQQDESVLCVAFSPDGQSVVTGSLDGSISIWEVQ